MHNNIGKPVSWSFRVLQNPLHWSDANLQVKADMGKTESFTVTLNNTGSDYQDWTMNGLPSWLKASPSSGSVPPYGTQDVTFTVSSSNAIGRYFATVSACTSIPQNSGNTLDTPLDISLTVQGEKPDWDDGSYPESMVVFGQICIDGILSTQRMFIVSTGMPLNMVFLSFSEESSL